MNPKVYRSLISFDVLLQAESVASEYVLSASKAFKFEVVQYKCVAYGISSRILDLIQKGVKDLFIIGHDEMSPMIEILVFNYNLNVYFISTCELDSIKDFEDIA